MEHFIKRFTIIDFLSMFIPGGILILALNYYVGDVAVPEKLLFGDNDLILAVYFVMISYITGMILQEVSKPLERLWKHDLKGLNDKWQKIPDVMEFYQKRFGNIIGVEESVSKETAARNIYLYVSDASRIDSKLDLFHAFSSMGRNSAAAGAIIALMSLHSPVSADSFTMPIVSLAFAVIMAIRNRRFFRLTQERAYRDFLKLYEEEESKSRTAAAV